MAELEWDDPNWSTGDTLTAQQFADHVTEGHFPSDELQFTINTNGNPAFVDPQNGDAEVLTYDRTAGTWVVSNLDADSATVTNAVDAGSVTADTLEATDSITDPEGNTVTSLEQSDPVRVTEEASTFAEGDVTVTHNQTQLASKSIKLRGAEIVDDFEDGDTTTASDRWDGWTVAYGNGTFTAQQTTVLSGTYSGELTVNNSYEEVRSTRTAGGVTENFKFEIEIGSDTGNSSDHSIVAIQGADGGITEIEFQDGTGNILVDSNDTGEDWSAGITYTVEFDFDFGAEEVTAFLDGVDIGTYAFGGSNISDYNYVELRMRTDGAGTQRSIYIDSLSRLVSPPTSGDALVEWDSAVPEDIKSYDLATFQRTLDGETVTVDVEDSQGNVLKSDISKDTDISDIPTTTDVQLRANLSRADTANNPTVDYLARRFTR